MTYNDIIVIQICELLLLYTINTYIVHSNCIIVCTCSLVLVNSFIYDILDIMHGFTIVHPYMICITLCFHLFEVNDTRCRTSLVPFSVYSMQNNIPKFRLHKRNLTFFFIHIFPVDLTDLRI